MEREFHLPHKSKTGWCLHLRSSPACRLWRLRTCRWPPQPSPKPRWWAAAAPAGPPSRSWWWLQPSTPGSKTASLCWEHKKKRIFLLQNIGVAATGLARSKIETICFWMGEQFFFPLSWRCRCKCILAHSEWGRQHARRVKTHSWYVPFTKELCKSQKCWSGCKCVCY